MQTTEAYDIAVTLLLAKIKFAILESRQDAMLIQTCPGLRENCVQPAQDLFNRLEQMLEDLKNIAVNIREGAGIDLSEEKELTKEDMARMSREVTKFASQLRKAGH